MSSEALRPPSRRKSNWVGKPSLYSLQGASGAGTPSEGGTTVSKYLQSRGIPADEARRLLVEAFLAETIDNIPFEPAREAALVLVQEHLAR